MDADPKKLLNKRIQIDRHIGLKGKLYQFAALIYPHCDPAAGKYIHGWHIEEVCNQLEEFFYGGCRTLTIELPPGCMKSMLCNVIFPIWGWLRVPTMQCAYASYDESLVGGRDGSRVKGVVNTEFFQERWGDLIQISQDSPTSDMVTSSGGRRFATSVRGKITGRHFHYICVDDAIKPIDCTPVGLAEVQGWRKNTLPSRIRPYEPGVVGGLLLVGQRLHINDLIGCERKEPTPSTTHLRFPMKYHPNLSSPQDRRKKIDELLWSERFSLEFLDSLGMAATVWESQYQQNPVPDGGLIFSQDMFRFYDSVDLPTSFDMTWQSWDCAFKGTSTSDYVVGQVWGKVGPKYYLLDQTRRQMGFSDTCKAIEAASKKWPHAMPILIEDKANGSAVIETLKALVAGVVAVNPEGGKEARAHAVEPLWASGSVFLPVITKAPWVGSFIEELAVFPGGGNDDTVDAMTQALQYGMHRASRLVAAMAAIRE